jgi:uncharacterized membrane protein YdbT with pleckstrin-like domain
MAIPLKNWHRLGKKTFWIFFLRHSKLFTVILALSVWFTYSVTIGGKEDSFNNFFLVNHADWYITPGLVMLVLWMAIAGYLLVIFLYSGILYRQYKFMLDEHAFYVRSGIFFIREVVIPYRQIQNVEINRPYLYRILGLAELDLTTLTNTQAQEMHNGKPVKKKNLLPVIDYRIAKILARNLVQRGTSAGQPFVVEDEDSETAVNG